MATAIQELIEDLNKEIDNCERNGLQYSVIYLDAIWKAENLLELEKQQIVDAIEASQRTDFYVKYIDSEEYYNETFNTK